MGKYLLNYSPFRIPSFPSEVHIFFVSETGLEISQRAIPLEENFSLDSGSNPKAIKLITVLYYYLYPFNAFDVRVNV